MDDLTEPNDAPKGRYELRAPNPRFKGVRLGIRFEAGVGMTDDLVRAKGVCEPQPDQVRPFVLIDHQTGRQLFPVVEEKDETQDDGTKGGNAA